MKGYYWKALCLAELRQRGASLAAAAVAECLFPLQWAQIPAVVEHFVYYIVKEVATVIHFLFLKGFERYNPQSIFGKPEKKHAERISRPVVSNVCEKFKFRRLKIKKKQ